MPRRSRKAMKGGAGHAQREHRGARCRPALYESLYVFSSSAWGLPLTFSIRGLPAALLEEIDLVHSHDDCSPGAAWREPLVTGTFLVTFFWRKHPGARLDSGLAMPLLRCYHGQSSLSNAIFQSVHRSFTTLMMQQWTCLQMETVYFIACS